MREAGNRAGLGAFRSAIQLDPLPVDHHQPRLVCSAFALTEFLTDHRGLYTAAATTQCNNFSLAARFYTCDGTPLAV